MTAAAASYSSSVWGTPSLPSIPQTTQLPSVSHPQTSNNTNNNTTTNNNIIPDFLDSPHNSFSNLDFFVNSGLFNFNFNLAGGNSNPNLSLAGGNSNPNLSLAGGNSSSNLSLVGSNSNPNLLLLNTNSSNNNSNNNNSNNNSSSNLAANSLLNETFPSFNEEQLPSITHFHPTNVVGLNFARAGAFAAQSYNSGAFYQPPQQQLIHPQSIFPSRALQQQQLQSQSQQQQQQQQQPKTEPQANKSHGGFELGFPSSIPTQPSIATPPYFQFLECNNNINRALLTTAPNGTLSFKIYFKDITCVHCPQVRTPQFDLQFVLCRNPYIVTERTHICLKDSRDSRSKDFHVSSLNLQFKSFQQLPPPKDINENQPQMRGRRRASTVNVNNCPATTVWLPAEHQHIPWGRKPITKPPELQHLLELHVAMFQPSEDSPPRCRTCNAELGISRVVITQPSSLDSSFDKDSDNEGKEDTEEKASGDSKHTKKTGKNQRQNDSNSGSSKRTKYSDSTQNNNNNNLYSKSNNK